MSVTTDYRKEHNPDTLRAGAMNEYRLLMYFVDLVRNFFSDSINIKDERLLALLDAVDLRDGIGKYVIAGTPFKEDMRESCTTPSIRVGLGEVNCNAVNVLDTQLPAISPAGWMSSKRAHFEACGITIAVITESYDGVVLLSTMLKDYLMCNRQNIIADCKMLNFINVDGATAPEHIALGQAGNAKDIFQRTLKVSTSGAYTHLVDVQGPVFRGVNITNIIK
jgi:hypothetical protein